MVFLVSSIFQLTLELHVVAAKYLFHNTLLIH